MPSISLFLSEGEECMLTNEQLVCEADSSQTFEEFFASSRVLREEQCS
jgi:hypothetical protein